MMAESGLLSADAEANEVKRTISLCLQDTTRGVEDVSCVQESLRTSYCHACWCTQWMHATSESDV